MLNNHNHSPVLATGSTAVFRFNSAPSPFGELLQMLGRDVDLGLTLAELHRRNLMLPGEGFYGGNERLTDRVHQRPGDELVTAMETKEAGHAALSLQLRNSDGELQSVDPLDFQGDVIAHDFGDAMR